MDPNAPLSKLIAPNFSFKDVPWNTMVEFAGTVITSKELNQKVLGKIAAEIAGQYGDKVMDKFSSSIYEQTGYKVSPSTLRGYRWVFKQVGYLNIPADLSYSAWKVAAGTEKPETWIHAAIDNGWSSSQLIREIKLSQGKTTKSHTCPNCGFTL